MSLLNAMARVAEGMLSRQMNDFAESSGILHPGDHGYRTGMSTSTALVEIQTRLMSSLEEGKLSSLCLLDVSSGFDTVSHSYLLRTLEMYGYDDKAIEWLASYLSNRT